MTSDSGQEQAPIDRLPNEILLAIFEFTVITTPSNPNLHLIVPLTHVSSRWREVLLSYGPIWSNIHIQGQDFEVLNTQIRRCQQAPLLVTIKVPSWRSMVNPSRYWELQENIQKAATLIRKCRNTVTRLHARTDCKTFQRLEFGGEWPRLNELVLVDTCLPNSRIHRDASADPFHAEFPKLKILSINGGPNWPMEVFAHLTTFKLKGPMDLKLTTITGLLRKNPLLESLELTDLNVKGSPGSQEALIKLPRLNELSVRYTSCRCILALLSLPSLQHLGVSSRGGQSPWLDSHWAEFCGRLSITDLEAQYYFSPRDRITALGSERSNAHSLRFTELSPGAPRVALFQSLCNISLSSITSLSLIKDMPEDALSSPLTSAICDLLNQLPQVEFMRLSPEGLTIGVVRRLSGNLELCPELRELEVTVTRETCMTAVQLVAEVVKGRAGGGNARKMRRVECLSPANSQPGEEAEALVAWNGFWREAQLHEYLCASDD